MDKMIIALVAAFVFMGSGDIVPLKQYQRLLRDTALQGQRGRSKATNEHASFLEMEYDDTKAAFILYPVSGKTELHVMTFVGGEGETFTARMMTDTDLDGAPDHYQVTNYKDGLGTVTYDGNDISEEVLELWYLNLMMFINLTGGIS